MASKLNVDINHGEVTLERDTASEFVDADFSEKKEMVKRVVGDDTAAPVSWNVVVHPTHLEVSVMYVTIENNGA